MTSRLAKIRFIADSVGNANYKGSFRGSNPQEQGQIDTIRRDFAPYLYNDNPPADVVARLGPIAEKLLYNVKLDNPNTNIDDIVRMYE